MIPPLERCSTKSPASPIPSFDDSFHEAPVIFGVTLSIFEGRLPVECEAPGTRAAADILASSPTRL